MAKMTNTSTIKIMLDGSQAENEVQRLRKQLKGVGEELAIVQEKFKGEREWDSGDTAEKLSKRIKELKKTQRALKSALDAHITQISGVDDVLARSSEAAYNELTKKRTSLLNLLKRLRLDTDEELKIYQEKSKALAEINKEISERDIDVRGATTVARAQEVLAKPEDFSTKEINDAVTAMTKFRDAKQADSEEWHHWNGYVQNGKKFLEEFNQKVKTTDMDALHADLQSAKPTISDKDLNMLVKYWEEMAQGAKAGSTAQEDFNKKLAEARALQTERKREQGAKVTDEVVGRNLLGGSISEMQNRLKLLQDYRNTIDSTKPDAYVRVDAAIEKLTQGIKESQAGFLFFDEAMKRAADLDHFDGTLEDLEKIQKVLKEGMAKELNLSDQNDLDRLKTTIALLDEIVRKQKELADINKRETAETSVRKVGANIAGSSPAEIEEAIRLAKDLQKMNGTSADQYKSLAQFIGEAEAQLKTWNDQVKHAAMENQFLRLATLSKNALEEQQKYWQSVFDNAEKGTAKYLQAERKLVDINKTLTDRKSDEAGAIMGNLQGSSVGDIERAIKMTEELMKAHSRGSQEYEIYAEEIKKAKEYLQSYVDMEKQVDMEDKWSRLRTLSTDALSEQKKYWQEMVDGAQQGTQELKNYQDRLKAVVEEERMRLDNRATKVLADPTDYSVKEVQEAVKAYEQIRDAQRLGSGEWEYYNKKIEDTRATLKKYNDEAKVTAMEGRLGGLTTASTASLAEQKKFWQEMVAGAERGTQALKDYQENLDKVMAEEKTRIQNAAQQTITDYNTGNWDKTIGETKEAIKQLQEYRNTLNQKTDAIALADVDEVLSKLTEKTKEAEQGYMNLATALSNAENASKGQFKGSVEDLEKLKKRLQEIRNTEIKLDDSDAADQLKLIDKALGQVDKALDEAKNGAYDFNKAVNQPWAVSFNDLKRAAEQLEAELKDCTEDVEDFAEKSEKLRNMQKRMKELNHEWKEHDGTIMSTIKRLASYVAVYGGFNFVWGKVKEATAANMALSDSMADIQKTTGMAAEEVADLGKAMDAMDTRTSQAELYNLAATAGQLGIRGKDNLLGFVKASNQITVALNELGADGTSTLMKIADLTGDIAKHGTENALLRIGSAINDLTATTTATAGPMVDFISRFGGVASAADIATHQMAAVGATADALKQEIEVTGTTMNKVVSAVTNNTRNLAAAVNVDFKALNDLVESGKTMEAIVMVFEAMSREGGVSAEALKALGSEGDRMNRVITSFVGNLDMLKKNLQTSAAAFDEMTSIQNEYNIKNENAAALWERIQNTLLEIVSNPRFVEWLTDMLNSLKGVTDWLVQSEGAARLLIGTLLTMIGMKVAAFFAAIGKSVHELNLILATSRRWFTNLGKSFVDLGASIRGATTLVGALKVAVSGLFRILVKHPIFLVAAAVGVLVTKFIDFKDANEKVAEASAKLAEQEAKLVNQFEKERSEAEKLTERIKKMNVDNKERKALIVEFNSKYGQYIGYMLQEKATAEEVAAAYELLNSKLTTKHQLEILNLRKAGLNEAFVLKQTEFIQQLREALSGLGVDEASMSKAIAYINTLAMQGKDASEMIVGLNELLGTDFKSSESAGYKRDEHGIAHAVTQYTDLGAALKNYAEYGKEHAAQVQALADEGKMITESASKEQFETQKKYLDEEYAKLQGMTANNQEEIDKRKEAYRTYYNTLNGYIVGAVGEQKTKLQEMMNTLKAEMEKVPELKSILDAWGKGANLDNWTTFAETIKNLDKASPKSLADTLDAIEKESQDISEATLPNFNEMFKTNFDVTNLDKFNKQVKGLAKQIKDRLAELGRGTDGNFLWGSGSGGGKSAKKKAQEEYKAALAALEAYFNERETLIREKGLKEGKTQVQINQELERLQTEKLNDEIQLRKLLLEEYWQESTFDPSKYKGVISGTDFFKDKNMEYLNELRVQLEKWGVAMEDGMKKQLTDRMVKLSEQALKLREKINKILLQDDFNEQVAQQYLDSLQELGLLFGLTESEITKTNEKNGEARLAYMREWAKESYSLNAQQLQDKIEQEAAFSQWRIGRTAEDYEALLIQLRKFHDDAEEAEKKSADRRKKIFDRKWEVSGNQKASELGIEKEEADLELYQKANELGLVSDYSVDEAQIELYKAKIKASQDYIEQIKKEMEQEILLAKFRMEDAQATLAEIQEKGLADEEARAAALQAEAEYQSLIRQQKQMTLDAENNIAEQRQLIAEREMAIEQRKMDTVKMYTDALSDFAQQMGEAAWGSVEDRQEAGKALLSNVLKISKDLLQTYLIEVTTRKMMNDMEIQNERYKQAQLQMIRIQSLASTGQTMIGEMTAGAALSAAQIELNAAEAASKEAAKKGWIGLAIGAAISVALSALLGAALGKINKAKSEVASATGASSGRLATGMLTYAEGNYPVLGNDGNVYNAKYEGSGMKTGIYRGGAHFGIFSEKKPEAIIDGDTTQRLIMNHPDIWKAIVTLSKNGRLDSGMGMRTFASGNINDLARQAQDMEATATADNSAQMAQMQATMAATQQALAQLTQVLAGGITARMDMYGENGAFKQLKKAEKFANRVGYK